MDILERRVEEALKLVLEAATLAEQGTAAAWEAARQYERASVLLELAGKLAHERALGNWSHVLERTAEGSIVQVWIGAGKIRSEG